MIVKKIQKNQWQNSSGTPLEEIMEEYGVDAKSIDKFLSNGEFLVKTKYNTVVKLEPIDKDKVRITPYFSEREDPLRFVFMDDEAHALSDKAEDYIDKRTGFLDLNKLRRENLDYFIENKNKITLIGLVSKVNREEFKNVTDFSRDLKRMEEEYEEDNILAPNYLMVVKCYDDITLQKLKNKLKSSKRFMGDLRIYHTGIYEFTLLSDYPVNQLLTGDLIVSFRSQPLTTFDANRIFNLRKQLFSDIVSDRNEEEENLLKGYFRALHHKTDETLEHSERMRRIVTMVGQELMLSDKEFETLWKMSMIHDVGKLAIETKIINKPARLTEEEYGIIKKHTILGYEMMDGIKSYEEAKIVCRDHHETWAGTGYPNKKKKSEVDQLVRIVSLADSIDAMASRRIYKEAFDFDFIRKELEEQQGLQFCPQAVKSALGIFDDIKSLY